MWTDNKILYRIVLVVLIAVVLKLVIALADILFLGGVTDSFNKVKVFTKAYIKRNSFNESNEILINRLDIETSADETFLVVNNYSNSENMFRKIDSTINSLNESRSFENNEKRIYSFILDVRDSNFNLNNETICTFWDQIGILKVHTNNVMDSIYYNYTDFSEVKSKKCVFSIDRNYIYTDSEEFDLYFWKCAEQFIMTKYGENSPNTFFFFDKDSCVVEFSLRNKIGYNIKW